MKLRYLLAFLILFAAAGARGQGIRFGDDRPVTSTQHVGSQNVYVPIASATINICAAPNVGLPCTNKATTYTDSTLNSTCPAGAQITLVGSSICAATTDSLGNWGVWVAAGNYTYTISSSVGTFGPFYFTAASGTGAGATLIPMSVKTFTGTPAFSAPTSQGYTMTLTGNVTSSSVTGSPVNGTVLALNLCQDATGGRTFVYPGNFVLPTTLPFNATANACNYLTVKFDGTNWTILNSSGSAQAGGNTGDVQCNVPTNVLGACSDINDANGTIALKANVAAQGPNPWVDVTRFGARAVSSGSIPTTTATISSGSASATLANGSSFVNGDGVRIDNAGANITLTTPSAPTVQSVLMGSSLGLPSIGNANAGSTTYGPYQIVARTKLGGWTIASAGGSTTTGPAALGIVATTISSTSLSGTTVTVNTTAPSDIVNGAVIWQPASGNQPWSGLFKVNGVNSPTQFTFPQQGLDSIGAVPIMSSGTIDYIVCNHVTWPAVTNAYQYWVYLNNARIAVTRPGETFYDDCGATINGTPVFPAYMPTTAPVAASPDPLVTTIVSGGGTNSVVLAATAGNTVAGARAVFDDAPAIKAAYNSVYSTASGTPLYFASPNPTARNSYIINSYLDLTGTQQLRVKQAAPIFVNETIAVPAGTFWEGLFGVGGASPPGFGWGQYREIQTNAALPGIYVVSGNQTWWDGIDFIGNHDQALSMLMDGGFNDIFTRCYFSTSATAGTGTVDYTSMGLMTRGTKNVIMDRVSMVSQMQNNLAMGPWAGVYEGRSDLAVANNTGQNFITNLFTGSKGIAIDYTGSFSDMQGRIDGYYTQGSRTPLLTLSGGSSLPGSWKIAFAECDTTGSPLLANLTITGFLNVDFANNSGASPGCGPLSGNVVASVTGIDNFQGTNAAVSNAYTANDGTRGYTFTNRIVNVKGPGTFIHAIGAYPVAPVLALVAGGTFSVSQHCFQYQWYDLLGNGGNVSPLTCINTTLGNQSVQVTVGTPPLGAFGFYVYADSARRNLGTPDFCSPQIQNGLVRIDTGAGTCGQSALTSAGMGDSGIRNQNIFSPSFSVIDPNNTGFTDSTAVPVPLTANRNINLPNQTGALVLTGNLQSVWDGFNRADGGPGANWTAINAGGVAIVSNQVKGSVAGAGYYASAYTGVSFQKDQFAQGTVINFANGETGVGVRNSGYDCTESGTTLFIHSNFAGNNLTSTGITGASGDVLRLEARGTTITCTRYVAGVLTNTLSVTDGGFTSGAPGVVIRQFNGSLTNALDDFSGGTIDPVAHLDNEQAWIAPQHFQSITVGPSANPALSSYKRFAATLSPALVAANTCAAQSFTVTGVTAADILIAINKPTEQAGLSVTPGHVSGANTATLNFCNNTGAGITPTATESYNFVVVQ